ncbi:hypothetical protein AB1N83_006046 [Pleurotus pulmonarius]
MEFLDYQTSCQVVHWHPRPPLELLHYIVEPFAERNVYRRKPHTLASCSLVCRTGRTCQQHLQLKWHDLSEDGTFFPHTTTLEELLLRIYSGIPNWDLGDQSTVC